MVKNVKFENHQLQCYQKYIAIFSFNKDYIIMEKIIKLLKTLKYAK